MDIDISKQTNPLGACVLVEEAENASIKQDCTMGDALAYALLQFAGAVAHREFIHVRVWDCYNGLVELQASYEPGKEEDSHA